MVIWIIGLAGAGKTTIATEVYNQLCCTNPNVVLLDGDHVRQIMGEDLGHTIDDRRKNAWRICRLCRLLDEQGIHVVCAILSMFHEHQDWNRRTYRNYFEVFIDVAFEELQDRDQKGLYSAALAGRTANVVGVDIPFDPPRADLVIPNNSPMQPPVVIAEQILAAATHRTHCQHVCSV